MAARDPTERGKSASTSPPVRLGLSQKTRQAILVDTTVNHTAAHGVCIMALFPSKHCVSSRAMSLGFAIPKSALCVYDTESTEGVFAYVCRRVTAAQSGCCCTWVTRESGFVFTPTTTITLFKNGFLNVSPTNLCEDTSYAKDT